MSLLSDAEDAIALTRLDEIWKEFAFEQGKWRKRVGVEPTGDIVDATHRF